MGGWIHLPRYIDKIRLHLAGQLHPDYQPNFGKGFDGLWLEHAGLTHEQMLDVVKSSLTDGQVCDWVQTHVSKTTVEKEALRQAILNYPSPDDAVGWERLNTRKQQSGLGQRDSIRCFVDYIDADEKRI